MSLETTSHIGCLVINKVAGTYARPYQREIERFLRDNGPEWTSNRVKSIWNAALHLKSGNPTLARQVYQENSIAYHKEDLLPKGPSGAIVSQFLSCRKPAALRRWAAVLRFYTGIKLPELTYKQYCKAKKSICTPVKDPLKVEQLSDEIVKGLTPWLSKLKVRPPKRDGIYADKLRGTSHYYSPFPVPKEMRGVPYASMANSLCSTSWVPDILDYRTPCQEMRKVIRDQGMEPFEVGKITYLQEGGCKCRVVAQPSAWLQLAFMPLHKILADVNRQILESCVEDQEQGVWFVLNAFAKGQPVISSDMTAATDRIPLALQTKLLSAIGLSDYAEALYEVSKRPFVSEYKGNKETFVYGAGQPMGLYGSFPLLNFTNICVAKMAQGLAKIPNGESTFRVLGDDIVFTNTKVAQQYVRIMTALGVELSTTKSRSGQVAEFAGFVVLPTTDSFTAFRPYKVPYKDHLNNPIEFLHSLGVKVTTLSKKWEDLFRVYTAHRAELTLSLSPLLPVEDSISSSTYRADNRWMISLSNRLGMLNEKLPDLSGDTHINRLPLFLEQRHFDFYGFNPEKYQVLDQKFSRPLHVGVPVSASAVKHPVIAEGLYKLREDRKRLTDLKQQLDLLVSHEGNMDMNDWERSIELERQIRQLSRHLGLTPELSSQPERKGVRDRTPGSR